MFEKELTAIIQAVKKYLADNPNFNRSVLIKNITKTLFTRNVPLPVIARALRAGADARYVDIAKALDKALHAKGEEILAALKSIGYNNPDEALSSAGLGKPRKDFSEYLK